MPGRLLFVSACLVALAVSAGQAARLQDPAAVPRDRPASAPQSPATGTIMGRVVDATTGAPIRRAMVAAYGGKGQDEHTQQHATLTDASGGFVIADLPAGPYGV